MGKAMDERRDSDKDQKQNVTDYEDLSGDCGQSLEEDYFTQSSMHLLLDPSTTGTGLNIFVEGGKGQTGMMVEVCSMRETLKLCAAFILQANFVSFCTVFHLRSVGFVPEIDSSLGYRILL